MKFIIFFTCLTTTTENGSDSRIMVDSRAVRGKRHKANMKCQYHILDSQSKSKNFNLLNDNNKLNM